MTPAAPLMLGRTSSEGRNHAIHVLRDELSWLASARRNALRELEHNRAPADLTVAYVRELTLEVRDIMEAIDALQAFTPPPMPFDYDLDPEVMRGGVVLGMRP